MATLLPRGKQQFIDATGAPLVGGKVYHYIPGTTTAKDTYQDANATILNSNPVILDGRGEAVIYGAGSYRQIVQDALGNTIWDQLTADTSSTNNVWGGTSTGSANAQVVLPGNFTSQSGQTITFIAGFTNSGALTVNGIPVVKDTGSGPVSLTGQEVTAGNAINVIYDANIGKFHLAIYPIAGASIPDGAVTTTKLADSNVTFAKLDPAAFASQAEAEAGSSSAKLVTPQRVSQAIAALSPQKLVRRYFTEYATYATLSTVIPQDDTVPTSTEGTQILSLSVVVDNSTQVVRLLASAPLTNSSTASVIIALFNGSTCLASAFQYVDSSSAPRIVTLAKEFVPGAAGTYTITVRAGPASGTAYINGNTANRLYGGSLSATLIAEVLTP